VFSCHTRMWLWFRGWVIIVAAVAVASVLIWQGIVAGGAPDPTVAGTSAPAAALDIAVLVLREGFESVLVLAVILASLRAEKGVRRWQRPMQAGIGMGFLASLGTWFVATSFVNDLTVNFGALSVQAGTGLLAIIVLLILMSWFVHKVYWGGWISMHLRSGIRSERTLIARDAAGQSVRTALLALGLMGFASVYREGVEVVLFLQSYYLRMSHLVVYYGATAGLVLAVAVGFLTLVYQARLPYKRMLVVTGILLTGVLFVMVGEQINEMQLAGWIGTTNIPWLQWIPAWAGLWFSIFPNVETFAAQVLAMLWVVGSWLIGRYRIQRAADVQGSW